MMVVQAEELIEVEQVFLKVEQQLQDKEMQVVMLLVTILVEEEEQEQWVLLYHPLNQQQEMEEQVVQVKHLLFQVLL
jgi:hypothetical protein|tara:strand:- start:252 stop:482 length:231 start_codon:yes stop_codon:yes gene_type:complete